MNSSKRVLVAPLNWGLGHATRCIPIIKELQRQKAVVLIASDGRALKLLKEEFPKLPIIELPAYNIHYPFSNMFLSIGIQFPKIIWAIFRERMAIRKLIEKEKIDFIISDNRFGCYSKKVKSIFLTHQLNIKIQFRFLERLISFLNHFWIQKFDECWIPDIEGKDSLAGDLSKEQNSFGQIKKTIRYIGALSRMKKKEIQIEKEVKKKYDVIIILSGPEPQRSFLEEKLLLQMKELPQRFLLVQGKTEQKEKMKPFENVEIVSFLLADELNEAILESEIVLCRSGYSSIMDLVKLEKKAILIPTPGQTEQEYLASRFFEREIFYFEKQKNFNLKTALKKVLMFNDLILKENSAHLLNNAIINLLK